MNSYYLIRNQDSKLLGPFTTSQFPAVISHRALTVNSEITGDLGPWLFVHDRKKMKLYYPTILTLISAHKVYEQQDGKVLQQIKNLMGFS